MYYFWIAAGNLNPVEHFKTQRLAWVSCPVDGAAEPATVALAEDSSPVYGEEFPVFYDDFHLPATAGKKSL